MKKKNNEENPFNVGIKQFITLTLIVLALTLSTLYFLRARGLMEFSPTETITATPNHLLCGETGILEHRIAYTTKLSCEELTTKEEPLIPNQQQAKETIKNYLTKKNEQEEDYQQLTKEKTWEQTKAQQEFEQTCTKTCETTCKGTISNLQHRTSYLCSTQETLITISSSTTTCTC